ncbi:NAD-dependent epimerase/dehydratase family protein [Paenibacillus abyssi]|uniref:NAD dependent epimerase/dehydratase n=1 Tax=Paenibacillus abyssi TaxID=1340531 RepID=A0A917CKF3_9BACL|nr:NAD-dependent epimerase/dehydratase family protein [Paenibacillus abyssi]GGF90444.1 NAD dependent epimerase/dehydratase [Paenibacillus abyssi]
MKILVLGGSSFFGKKLVRKLINQHDTDVTIATRGLTKIDEEISSKTRQLVIDRTDLNSLERTLGSDDFDVVYDQICFNPVEAKIAVEVFSDRVKRFVLTSSMAVYDGTPELLRETDFDPIVFTTDLTLASYNYKEGKRQAEAYLYQNAPFQVISVRPPAVISSDDKRFAFYIAKILKGEPIGTLGSSTISFISANEIADFLLHIGTKTDYIGPINANNSGYYNTEELALEIGRVLNISPIFDIKEKSPYCVEQTLKISNELATSTGFTFRSTKAVIRELVNEAVNVK